MFSKTNDKRNNQHFNSLFKEKLLQLFSLVLLFIAITPTVLEASTNYFLSFTYDTNGKAISSDVSFSDVSRNIKNHAELKSGTNYLYNAKDSGQFMMNGGKYSGSDGTDIINIAVPSTLSGFNENFKEDRKNYPKKYENILPYSFPGHHIGTTSKWNIFSSDDAKDGARNATSQDREQAFFVGDELTNGFNRLLNAAYNGVHPGGNENVSVEELHSIAQRIADLSVKEGSEKFGQVTIRVGPAEDTVDTHPNIKKGFYRTFTITGADYDNEKITVPVAVNKGYDNGDNARMKNAIENTPYANESKNEDDVFAISWENMVMQAGYNASQGVLASDASELNPPGKIEQSIMAMFGPIGDNIRSSLGLSRISDLVFNQGNQSNSQSTVWGTIPKGMAPVADFVYTISLIFALFIGIGSFVSLIIRSQLAVMNPQMRVDIKDGFMTIIGAMFVLVAFKPIWNSMMRLNYHLVEFFYSMAGTGVIDLRATLAGGGGFATVILTLAFVIVEIWFNFYYIVRAITILILYMFAPFMIISISYGGQHKRIFGNWVKELSGALFSQAIQAGILGVLTIGISRGMASSVIWQFVIIISIIPLSNLIRENILGLGGSSIGTTAERAEKGAMMVGATGAAFGLAATSKATSAGVSALAGTSGGGPSGGGSGGGGGGGSSNKGKNKLGDEEVDKAPIPYQTGEQRRNEAMANATGMEKVKFGAGKALDSAKSGAQKTAKVLDSNVVRGGAHMTGQAVGAVVAAGSTVGDVATDGGSSEATRHFGRKVGQITGGGGKGSRSGGGGRGSYNDPSSPEGILENSAPKKELNDLKKGGYIGKHGSLMLTGNDDGSQTLTMDKESLQEETGYTNIQSYGASEEFENGMTQFTYDSEQVNHQNEDLLRDAAQITEDYQTNKAYGTLTPDIEGKYHQMRQSTGMANVTVDGFNAKDKPIYNIEVDNKAMGWQGTATDGDNLHVKADAHTIKSPPNFDQAAPSTQKMNRQFYQKPQANQSQSK